MVQISVPRSFYSHLLIIPCWSEFGLCMYHTWLSKASFLCGISFCKSSQDTFISCLFFLLFFWLFPCPITQRSWIIWLIVHFLSSAMILQANFSVKTFSSLVSGFSKIHLSCYGFTCSESFLSKGFQQSTLRVKQRFQAQVFIRKSC